MRDGGQGHRQGSRDQTTVWSIDGKDEDQDEDTSHSTQKPVECMARVIRNNNKSGDGIYEPFSGSGTTIIAGEIEQRRCYAIELSPEYVDVAVLRWQAFTGKEAVLEGSGSTYPAVAQTRTNDHDGNPDKKRNDTAWPSSLRADRQGSLRRRDNGRLGHSRGQDRQGADH